MRTALLLLLTLPAAALAADAKDLTPGEPEAAAEETFEATNKPSGMMPAHTRIKFPKGAIDLVNIAAWEKLFEVEPKTAKGCVTDPIAAFKKLLKSKALPPKDKEVPFASCPDASQSFVVQPRRVKFKGGEGLLWVTEFSIEPVLPSNTTLEAVFQGLTTDGKTWVGGAFKLEAKGLRADGGELVKDGKALMKQVTADAAMLSKLKAADFTPDLDALAAALGKLDASVAK